MSMKPDHRDHPVGQALRRAGFVPLPRLWVKQEDMPDIRNKALSYQDAVNEIRGQARRELLVEVPARDPRHDMDAAWAAFERDRGY